MKVGVIGAGVSGLAAIKELLDEGHEPVCFERENREGGVFNFPAGVAYRSMKLTVSQYFMAYSAFPPPLDEEPRYWTREDYAGYLRRYGERFGLLRHIRFDTNVTAVRRTGTDSFIVSYRHGDKTGNEAFDAVAVCRGAFRRSDPQMPPFAGMETFDSEILHAADYRGPEPFKGKRVLCVGMGETSADVVDQVSRVTQSCCLSIRRYPAMMARYPFGGKYTHDTYTTRVLHRDRRSETNAFTLGMCRLALTRESDPRKRLPMEWMVRSKTPCHMSFSKNDDFVDGILEGRIRVVHSAVERLQGNTVIFEDGTRTEVDAIICCTGYDESSIPGGWIDGVNSMDVRSLYLHAFHPNIGQRVAFIGWVRPAQGGVPACSEMVARYFSLLCSSERRLPAREKIDALIERDRRREDGDFFAAPKLRTLVDYTTYMDRLAALVGCEPRLEDHLDDPALLCRLIAASNISACYRLRGPHADPEQARRTIMHLPIAFADSMVLRKASQVLKRRCPAPVRERALSMIRAHLAQQAMDQNEAMQERLQS